MIQSVPWLAVYVVGMGILVSTFAQRVVLAQAFRRLFQSPHPLQKCTFFLTRHELLRILRVIIDVAKPHLLGWATVLGLTIMEDGLSGRLRKDGA